MNLYQEQLLDHYRNPRNRGTLEQPDLESELHNPSCGDSISLQGLVHNGIVKKLMFQGKGCVISQAAASLLTEHCQGKSLVSLSSFTKDLMLDLIGIELGPTRLKCALLSLQALQQATQTFQKKDL